MTLSAALLQLGTAALGSWCFSMIFNVRDRQLCYTTLGGLLSWAIFLALMPLGWGTVPRFFISSVGITIYAEIFARRRKTPATVFLVPAAVPLIPGAGLYNTMLCAVHMDGDGFIRQGLNTLLLAGAIAAGIILVSTVMHAADAYRRKNSPANGAKGKK